MGEMMNIFYLDEDPIVAARMQHDKHVVKMILETAQLLCTAHRVLDGVQWTDRTKNGSKIQRWRMEDEFLENTLYKATHRNHPSAVWARETSANYNWLYAHFVALCEEYTYRYGKVHKTDELLRTVLIAPPKNIRYGYMTMMPQAMPDEYKSNGYPVQGYRNYYLGEKITQSKWTRREQPSWI